MSVPACAVQTPARLPEMYMARSSVTNVSKGEEQSVYLACTSISWCFFHVYGELTFIDLFEQFKGLATKSCTQYMVKSPTLKKTGIIVPKTGGRRLRTCFYRELEGPSG